MSRSAPHVVLFDFFGTLVRYEPDRTALAYPQSHALVTAWGWEATHEEFVRLWNEASEELEAGSAESHEELRMVDYAATFAHRCGRRLSAEQCEELAVTFVSEWGRHVRPIDGVAEMLADLGESVRLAIVSNTNDTEMVPRLVRDHFAPDVVELIVLSVDHGYRKPHPSIYAAALSRLGCDAADAVFVGDSYEADYVGPTAAGMGAFLIDPSGHSGVPDSRRLDTVLDLRSRL